MEGIYNDFSRGERIMNKKVLYCPQCKVYPDKIIEMYTEPIEEQREWDGTYYALYDSNIDNVEFEQICAKCRTRLEYYPEGEQ